ncbi:EpsG family protein [Saccharicrinis sp. GN24d3]|uniref:EpsG family protein n=1 Tax=Saccharicrinis sp. GN24d3 TaxID=3458416 RepID=UPI004035759E
MYKNLSYQFVSSSFLLNTRNYLILFVIWPFAAFVSALVNYKEKVARRVAYIYLIYYGFTFAIGELGGEGSDSERYAMRFIENARRPFSDFFNIVGGMYSSDTSVDIVEPLISFVVSRFTSYHGALFAVYAALFGFFYLKSINFLHDSYQKNPGWNAMIHLAFFVFILPITSINGFRMWTAAWIYFYGAYQVVVNRDLRFIVVAVFASLVHFSFLTANLVLIVYALAGNKNYIYLPITLASFVLPDLLAPTIESVSYSMGGSFADRYEGYSNTEYGEAIQESMQQATWFMKLNANLLYYYLLTAVAIVQLKHRKMMEGRDQRNLFSFLLLFLSFVNFGSVVPSLGGRFQILFYMFATAYLFMYQVQMPGRKINPLTLVGIFPMLLYVAVNFRMASDSINAWILTPGLGIPLFVPAVSLAEALFG